jgi:hypothetical protein
VRKNKKNIAYAVLIGFLLALAPRSFFHDCHQHVAPIGKEKTKHCIDQKDCDFCAYEIGDFACSQSFHFAAFNYIPFIAKGLPAQSCVSTLVLPLFFRGPPVC